MSCWTMTDPSASLWDSMETQGVFQLLLLWLLGWCSFQVQYLLTIGLADSDRTYTD